MAEAFGVAASALAVIELSAKVALQCAKYAKEAKNATKDIERVNQEVTHWRTVVEGLRTLLDNPAHREKLQVSQQLHNALRNAESLLESLHHKLTPSRTRRAAHRFVRALKWPFDSQEVDQILQDLLRCMQLVQMAIQLDHVDSTFKINETTLEIKRTVLISDQSAVLNRLPIAEGAAFDSHVEELNQTCLPNTRVGLLSKISEWKSNPDAKALFWLNGMAGTGKSTISRTLARTSFGHGCLGASFFFKKGEGDRGKASKLFTSIAYQLVQSEPALAPHVKAAIDADPAIIGKSLQQQFEKLIVQPLSDTRPCDRKADVIVIVIDALDECDEEEHVRLIIQLLSRAIASKSMGLRVFVTSRPELPIRLGFRDVKGTYQDLVLHEIEHTIIERDLSVYFSHELKHIKETYNTRFERQLPPTWPEQSDIQNLVTMAVPLFIFAATACRFLADHRGSPDAKLRKILEYQTNSHTSQLRATYLPILDQLVTGLSERDQDEAIERFKRIIGSIVLLANPLSIPALACLLDTTVDEIDEQLDLLHSVLRIPSSRSNPVRLLHLSFRDFLVDPANRSNNTFWVDEKGGHERLAADCIRIMNETLRADICEAKWPGTSRTSIDSDIISDKLTPAVQYACQYWISHIQQAGTRLLDDGPEHHFLDRHFLHWLEASSLLGRAPESIQSIQTLQTVCQSQDCPRLSQFVDDALRFVLANRSVLQEAPLQLYSSALIFAPKTSIVRNRFQDNIPSWIVARHAVNTHWSSCLQALEGHSNTVCSISFSPDGKVIASGSWDKTIRLWSRTGEHLQTLEGHTKQVNSVAFSPDGGKIISGSNDKTIRVWSRTGEHLQTLEGHSNAVSSVTFSPDGKVIASGSWDTTIRLWSCSGEHLRTLEGHTKQVNTVVFSPDGGKIISGSNDKTIRVWSHTGEHLKRLLGHSGGICSVSCSPDGKLIASGSWDTTIRLWSCSGEHLRTLKGHTLWVNSIAFSPDSSVILSASDDYTIRLWSRSGEQLKTLAEHTNCVYSAVFPPDGSVIASGSSDKTIRLWSIDTGTNLQTPEGHTMTIPQLLFSPDGSVIASGSLDRTVRLWSANTGTHLQTLSGHIGEITALAFPLDSSTVASGSKDNTIRLWSVGTGAYLHTLEGHAGEITTIVFSPDGSTVASGSWDKTIRLWSVGTGACLHTLEGHMGRIFTIVFSPDGSTVASGSWDKTMRLWSVGTGACLRTLEGHTDVISRIVFSSDGSTVASGSYDKTIRFWSVGTGACLRTLGGHAGEISALAFSPDGSTVASGSFDNTIRLWSTATGAYLQSIKPDFIPNRLAFSSDGRTLITDFDRIPLNNLSGSIPIAVMSDTSRPSISTWTVTDQESRQAYGFSKDGAWVTYNGRNLLRLLADCRNGERGVSGSTVAIGCNSGRMVIIRFSDEGVSV